MLLQKEILNLLLLGLELGVVYAAAGSCLVPWIELEIGVCSLRVRAVHCVQISLTGTTMAPSWAVPHRSTGAQQWFSTKIF